MLRFLAGASPHDAAPLFVDLQHEPRGFLLVVSEELADHMGHIAHEIDGVIVDDHVPRLVEYDLGFFLGFGGGAALGGGNAGHGVCRKYLERYVLAAAQEASFRE